MTVERRQFQRIRSSLDVQWEIPPEIGSAAQITNLSVNGCFMETRSSTFAEALSIGQLISFVVVFPEGNKMPVQGRVMYHNPPHGFGVLFTPLTPEQRDAVSDYLDQMVDYFSGR